MDIMQYLAESGPVAVIAGFAIWVVSNLAKQSLEQNAAMVAALNANTAALNKLAGFVGDKETGHGE